jgi:hypothetical protein
VLSEVRVKNSAGQLHRPLQLLGAALGHDEGQLDTDGTQLRDEGVEISV